MRAQRILVTGASGFIGGHLCRHLAERGEIVRALYRRRDPPAELKALAEAHPASLELFNADLADEDRVAEAVSGMDAVIHSAALAADWGGYELFKSSNYDAARYLAAAAAAAGVPVFVYLSSAVVHGFGSHVDTTEEGPYFPLKYPYQITKLMAERELLRMNRVGFRVVAIRPCNVYGPGDRTSTYAMFEAILSGIFGYIGAGEAFTCPVYIDDLCAGVLAALDREETGGEAILIGDGQKVRWKDYVEVMYEAVGTRRRPIAMPKVLAFAGAAILSFGARLIGSPVAPPLTTFRVEQGSSDYHFSPAKAKRLLGFEPKIFYREGLMRTAQAFLAERVAERVAERATGRAVLKGRKRDRIV
jgi:nucleoside-diphosphate-sugar epimerase